MKSGVAFIGAMIAAVAVAPRMAHAETNWWPFAVEVHNGGPTTTKMEYTPPAPPTKHWKFCALIPNLADSYWLAINYGMVEEAKRLGITLTTLAAGGYDQLPKQISQFDDCVSSGADAILLGAISEAGFAGKLAEASKKGLIVIGVANPIEKAPVTAKITVSHFAKGKMSGDLLVQHLGIAGGEVVAFPGPQGSGWAESYLTGFEAALKGSKVKLMAAKFGEANVPDQLNLVTDALQAYPDMNAIWGGAPTVEAALGAVAEDGRTVSIVSSWENQAMLDAVTSGKILGFAAEYPVIMARISVDLGVQALEKSLPGQELDVVPGLITKANLDKTDLTQIFAAKGFRPVFNVH
jgi:protein TorT